jgi:hypothetical protein
VKSEQCIKYDEGAEWEKGRRGEGVKNSVNGEARDEVKLRENSVNSVLKKEQPEKSRILIKKIK